VILVSNLKFVRKFCYGMGSTEIKVISDRWVLKMQNKYKNIMLNMQHLSILTSLLPIGI